jgi:hypothetical protein
MAYSLDENWDDCIPVARAGNACFGVYVRCGIWSRRNLTDGFVPAEIALGKGSPEQARKLVEVGLWEVVEGGYLDPWFLKRNPSAEQVNARRDADADRKARWRDAKRKPARSSTQDTTRDSARSHGVTDDRTPGFRSPLLKEGTGRGGAAPENPLPPTLRVVPDWCGRCHRDTRMAVDDNDRSVPCQTCHPRRTA